MRLTKYKSMALKPLQRIIDSLHNTAVQKADALIKSIWRAAGYEP